MDRNDEKTEATLQGTVCTGCMADVRLDERALAVLCPGDGDHVLSNLWVLDLFQATSNLCSFCCPEGGP